MTRPKIVLITGASSGIGRALAREYAQSGMTIGLVGRNAARLADVERECRAAGAHAVAIVADIADGDTIVKALRNFDARFPVDLLIANAGIAAPTPEERPMENLDDAERIVRTNILGTFYCVDVMAAAMRARGRGQIAIVGSLMARTALAASPAYSASKAAVESYGAGLRGILRKDGIDVSVISPGFVESDMSNRVVGPKPFLMNAARAARIIRRGLERNLPRIAFPRALAWTAALGALLPASIARAALKPFGFHVKDGD